MTSCGPTPTRHGSCEKPRRPHSFGTPNIVPVFEAGVDGHTYYIASAFIEGQTLKDAIDEEQLDFQRAAKIVIDLAGALEYAHGKGIVHRDVKPANIMLDESGDVLLADFGLARLAGTRDQPLIEGTGLDARLTQMGSALGTPAYMPPEQASGQHDRVGPASDQYSLGVVLYELLCGETPFSGPAAMVMSLVINEEPPSPRGINPQVPRDLETICLKAMAKSPARRFAGCPELSDDLRRWSEGEPIHARRISPVERLWRWCRRNPALAAVSATAALLLVSVATMAAVGYLKISRAIEMADVQRQQAQSALEQKAAAREQADAERKQTASALQREAVAREQADTERTWAKEALKRGTDANQDRASRMSEYAGLPFAEQLIQSEHNLMTIGLAISDFHDAIGKYPPAVVYGPDDKPWHSWRVLILPYLGDGDYRNLFRRYRFDKPWDDPANKPVLEAMPPVYRDPVYGDQPVNVTHYAVVTTPSNQWRPAVVFPGIGTKMSGSREPNVFSKRSANVQRIDIRDGLANTILVGPVSPERGIPWTRPEDILITGNEQPTFHCSGAPVTPHDFAMPYKIGETSAGVFLFADGTTRILTDRLDEKVLSALCTIQDGLVIDWQTIESLPLAKP